MSLSSSKWSFIVLPQADSSKQRGAAEGGLVLKKDFKNTIVSNQISLPDPEGFKLQPVQSLDENSGEKIYFQG
jgi:hypothetical protein